MAGYIRQDTTGAISNNSIIEADDLNSEFDAVEGAFNAITGHKHDGTSAEGAPIEVVGPAQDVVITASTIRPKTDNTVDLGTPTLEFKDLYLDGTANIDNLVADAGTVAGSAITTVSNTQALTNKTVNLANNTLVATSAQLAAAITDETGTGSVVFSASPTLTGTPAAPTAAAGINTTQVATTAHVFAERTNTATLTNKTLTSPDINTPDINGGTIDGTVIGGSTPAAITGTTVVSNADALIHGATVGRGGGGISSNTAVGSGALSSNTTGGANTANGVNALQSNTTGDNNTANGLSALQSNTTGVNNTANGLQALLNNTTGSNNTANGVSALQSNTTGDNNTANGLSALLNNTTGSSNTANGRDALEDNTTGISNTANGRDALQSNTTGSNNTANGRLALFDNTEGLNNIGIGVNAGRSSSPRTITTASNEICIGNNSHTGAFIKIAFTVTSDARDKAELAPIPHGLEFVNALQPTEYQFKAGGRDGEADGIRRYGFLAQDVLAAEGDNPVIVNNDDTDSLKMTHDYLIPVLVNAVKELTAQVNDLMAEVAALKGQ